MSKFSTVFQSKQASAASPEQLEENDREFLEGFRTQIKNEIVRRNRKLIDKAKRVKGFACAVCGFDFGRFYGPHGAGFIEGHHKEPVASYTSAHTLTIDDIECVCANCHRMLHRGSRILTIDELKAVISDEVRAADWPWIPKEDE